MFKSRLISGILLVIMAFVTVGSGGYVLAATLWFISIDFILHDPSSVLTKNLLYLEKMEFLNLASLYFLSLSNASFIKS